MYVKDGVQVLCPDGNAGLYVKTRNGEIVKVIDFSYSDIHCNVIFIRCICEVCCPKCCEWDFTLFF